MSVAQSDDEYDNYDNYDNLNDTEKTEIGLKRQIIKLKNLLSRQEEVACHSYSHLLIAWRSMRTNGVSISDMRKIIWEFIDNQPIKYGKSVDSKIFGIFTIIKDYTNKRGKTHKAHYTEAGKYMGPVSKLGEIPISYKRTFGVTRDYFQIDFSKLMSPETKKLYDIFEPIEFEV